MKRLFFILIIFISSSISFSQKEKFNLLLDENYPLWLKSDKANTDQTSGIAFIKNDCSTNYFLLADDIGAIHLAAIKENKIEKIDKIEFVNETERFFPTFPKMDFEDIAFDKETGEAYLSVEGNGEKFNDFVGIFKLIFKNRDVFTKQVVAIIRINFRPQNLFFKYTSWNIGYEGIALNNKYFFLGLEGFQKDNLFADSTLIFIANKNDMEIVKTINTKEFGIHTVCGLFTDEENSLWGVDRNNRKIFHFLFDEKFNVKEFTSFNGTTEIPGFKDLNYLPSFESITMDDKKNIYVVDDPWKTVFIPAENIYDQLDEETKTNFKNYIPTIYKYKLTPKGDN